MGGRINNGQEDKPDAATHRYALIRLSSEVAQSAGRR